MDLVAGLWLPVIQPGGMTPLRRFAFRNLLTTIKLFDNGLLIVNGHESKYLPYQSSIP